jgi:DNA-binding phage protein
MRMGGNRTLFGKSTTGGSDYARVKPPRRTNDLLVLNKDDVLDLLRVSVKREGGQTAFARHHGINRSYLNMVLRGKRPMGHAVADALGLRIVYVAK